MVSIDDGIEIGVIGSFLLDFTERRLAGFVLSSKRSRPGVLACPYSEVCSIGSFAVTVNNSKAAVELVNDKYFLELFEKELLLFGATVYLADSDKKIGFVKDAILIEETGAISALRITNDSGFMSPYNALVPIEEVVSVSKDKISLSAKYKPNFFREGPMGTAADSKYCVPLVVQEPEWREALSERITEEMDKVAIALKEQLAADHEQFFLSHEKENLRSEISGGIIAEIDGIFKKNLDETLSAFRARLEETAASLVTASSFSAFGNDIGKVLSALIGRLDSELPMFENRLTDRQETLSDRVEELKENLNKRIEFVLESLDRDIHTFFNKNFNTITEQSEAWKKEITSAYETRAMQAETAALELERELHASINDLRKSGRESVESLSASIGRRLEENIKKVETAASDLAGRVAAIETNSEFLLRKDEFGGLKQEIISSAIRITNDLRKDAAGRINRAQAELDSEISTLKKGLESRLSAVKKELESAAAASVEDSASLLIENFQAIRNENSAEIIKLREHIEKKLAAAQENLPAPDTQELKQELLGETALLEKRLSELVARNNSELKESFEALKTATADDLHSLGMEINDAARISAAALESLRAELEEKISLTETFLPGAPPEELAKLKAEISEKLNRLKAEELGRLKAELKEELNSSAEEILRQVDGKMSDLQSGLMDNLIATLSSLASETGKLKQDLETRLDAMVDKNELESRVGGFATLENLEFRISDFVSKKNLENRVKGFATLENLEAGAGKFATIENVKNLEAGLSKLASKEELKAAINSLPPPIDPSTIVSPVVSKALFKISALEEKIASLSGSVDSRLFKLDEGLSDIFAKIQDFKKESAPPPEQETLQLNLDALKDEFAYVKSSVAAVESTVIAVKSSVAAVKASVDNDINTINKLCASLAAAASEKTNYASSEESNEEINSLKEEISGIKTIIDKRFCDLSSAFDCRLADFDEGINGISTALQNIIADISASKLSEEIHSDVSSLRSEIETIKISVYSLKDQFQTLQTSVPDETEPAVPAEIDALRSDLEAIRNAVDSYRKSQDSIKNEMGETILRLSDQVLGVPGKKELETLEAGLRNEIAKISGAIEKTIADATRLSETASAAPPPTSAAPAPALNVPTETGLETAAIMETLESVRQETERKISELRSIIQETHTAASETLSDTLSDRLTSEIQALRREIDSLISAPLYVPQPDSLAEPAGIEALETKLLAMLAANQAGSVKKLNSDLEAGLTTLSSKLAAEIETLKTAPASKQKPIPEGFAQQILSLKSEIASLRSETGGVLEKTITKEEFRKNLDIVNKQLDAIDQLLEDRIDELVANLTPPPVDYEALKNIDPSSLRSAVRDAIQPLARRDELVIARKEILDTVKAALSQHKNEMTELINLKEEKDSDREAEKDLREQKDSKEKVEKDLKDLIMSVDLKELFKNELATLRNELKEEVKKELEASMTSTPLSEKTDPPSASPPALTPENYEDLKKKLLQDVISTLLEQGGLKKLLGQ